MEHFHVVGVDSTHMLIIPAIIQASNVVQKQWTEHVPGKAKKKGKKKTKDAPERFKAHRGASEV